MLSFSEVNQLLACSYTESWSFRSSVRISPSTWKQMLVIFFLNAEQYVQLAGFQRHVFLCWIVNIIQSHVLLSAHFIVLQIFNLCCVVAISLAMADDLEPGHTNGVDNGSPIRKKLHISHLCTHTDTHTRYSSHWLWVNHRYFIYTLCGQVNGFTCSIQP